LRCLSFDFSFCFSMIGDRYVLPDWHPILEMDMDLWRWNRYSSARNRGHA
jgi:hypothetical protein